MDFDVGVRSVPGVLTSHSAIRDVPGSSCTPLCDALPTPLEFVTGLAAIRPSQPSHLSDREEYFVGLLAHELRAPTTALQMHAEYLVRYLYHELGSQDVRATAQRIHGLAERLGEIIDDLYDLVKISVSSDGLRLEHAQVDLLNLVYSTVEIAQALPGAPPIIVEAPESALKIVGDSSRLRRALLNLLTNAIKHAPDSERIDVRVRQADGSVLLDIEDYGPGIQPDALPHIFGRYQQQRGDTADTGTADRGGLGLGLFIAQQLVRAHGGEITVTSTLGAGSRFTMRIPLP